MRTLPESLSTTDGTRLHLRHWPREGARGTVLVVHGLGEHSGRYEFVAAWLVARGWEVVAYDQRGHGRSEGARGVIPTADALLRDLEQVIDIVRPSEKSEPLVLLAHSMGGAVAAHLIAEREGAVAAHVVAEEGRAVDGLVLTSPAFAADLSSVQRLQLWIGERLAPSVAQGNGLDPNAIAHDPEVVRAYIEDPLVHDRISARLARATLDGGTWALAHASAWSVPTLLMYAGSDRLVAPRGSDAFAASAPREVVEAERFDALYHEILNEGTLAAPVYARLERWLDARFPR